MIIDNNNRLLPSSVCGSCSESSWLQFKAESHFIFVGSDKRHYEQFADGTVRDIEDEIPFDVPEGWAWTKIHCVSSEILYGVSESAKEKGKYKLLRITDIQDDKVNWDSVPFTDFPEDKITNYILKNGDIVFARTGATVGKSYLIENLTVESIYASYLIRIRTSLMLNPKYMKYYFGSLTYWNQITDKSSGIGQPNVNGTSLANLYIPIPPYNEQERILPVIEKAFRLINSLENNKSALQTAIKQAKSKILDLAIHGKLVPQDPNDEPAEELLKRIATSDNRPYEKVGEESFEIPHSWKWVRLGSVCDYGKCINVSTSDLRANDWILDLEDIEKDSGKILAFHTLKERKSESTKHKFTKGQVLYSKLRPYLNKVVIAPKDGFCTSEILPLDFNEILLNRFAQIVLMSSYFLTLVNMVTYGVKMPRLGTGDAKNMLIPIPPLNEQKRIVSKIDELFSNLDQIQNNLI